MIAVLAIGIGSMVVAVTAGGIGRYRTMICALAGVYLSGVAALFLIWPWQTLAGVATLVAFVVWAAAVARQLDQDLSTDLEHGYRTEQQENLQ